MATITERISQFFYDVLENRQLVKVQKDASAIQGMRNPSEAVQRIAVRADADNIRYISNPTERIQQMAVEADSFSIRYIPNASEELKMKAVTALPDTIQYIANPSENLKWAAVQDKGSAIQYISNPSDSLKWAAVQDDWSSIRYIPDASEKLKMAAVQRNGLAVQYISNPSEAVKMAAVNNLGSAIRYISDPSEELKLAAVKNDGLAIQYIPDPTEEMKLVAVQKEGLAIQYISDPTEEMKLAAVKERGFAIDHITNPTEEMKIEAVKNNVYSIIEMEEPTPSVCKIVLEKTYGQPINVAMVEPTELAKKTQMLLDNLVGLKFEYQTVYQTYGKAAEEDPLQMSIQEEKDNFRVEMEEKYPGMFSENSSERISQIENGTSQVQEVLKNMEEVIYEGDNMFLRAAYTPENKLQDLLWIDKKTLEVMDYTTVYQELLKHDIDLMKFTPEQWGKFLPETDSTIISVDEALERVQAILDKDPKEVFVALRSNSTNELLALYRMENITIDTLLDKELEKWMSSGVIGDNRVVEYKVPAGTEIPTPIGDKIQEFVDNPQNGWTIKREVNLYDYCKIQGKDLPVISIDDIYKISPNVPVVNPDKIIASLNERGYKELAERLGMYKETLQEVPLTFKAITLLDDNKNIVTCDVRVDCMNPEKPLQITKATCTDLSGTEVRNIAPILDSFSQNSVDVFRMKADQLNSVLYGLNKDGILIKDYRLFDAEQLSASSNLQIIPDYNGNLREVRLETISLKDKPTGKILDCSAAAKSFSANNIDLLKFNQQQLETLFSTNNVKIPQISDVAMDKGIIKGGSEVSCSLFKMSPMKIGGFVSKMKSLTNQLEINI
ncbi:DUF4116 domain-containing protein [Bacteroides fragilis]|uniref:DUF4116 domain-containing protein n=1 Tax=Bacteroides fragilis TaxID=817 RepID=UPI001C702F2C|nr:DUF4116 domain-containing protein [Bacteroides fragilis]MBW9280226.1 hypothetical protein [Bacteroides fragilis]